MIDYELSNGDIVIRSADLAFVDGSDATRQRLQQKFRLWLGEWFLNVNAGVPWLRDILGQRPRPEVINSLIRRVVRDDPGVRSVTRLDIDFEGAPRRLTVEFEAALVDGGTIADTVEIEF